MVNTALYPAISWLPTMWLQLVGLSLAASPSRRYQGSGPLISTSTNADAAAPLFYVLDSGTSLLSLTPSEYAAVMPVFGAMLRSEPRVKSWECADDDGGCIVRLDRVYTPSQLNGIFPPLLFTFQGGSAPVPFLPGDYLIYGGLQAGLASYNVYIQSFSGSIGILGNSWMTGWLLQQTRSTRKLRMTRVQSCDDVTY